LFNNNENEKKNKKNIGMKIMKRIMSAIIDINDFFKTEVCDWTLVDHWCEIEINEFDVFFK